MVALGNEDFSPPPAEIREPIAPGAEELFGDCPIERCNASPVGSKRLVPFALVDEAQHRAPQSRSSRNSTSTATLL